MNILISGASGKMGNEVRKFAENVENCNIVCGFDKFESNENGFKIYNDINKINENIDVIIDFSIPAATFKILEFAIKENLPVVVATTGFSEDENKKIEEISKIIPIFKSSNMSLDINLMCEIIQKVAQILTDADIEIIEKHHNRKIDSPSGTAILLANSINSILENKKEYDFYRMQKREPRKKNEIGFSSIRGGNIVGEHSVQFYNEYETLEITHKAYDRQIFASGAIKAAEFILGKKSGLYNMNDILKK